VPVSWNLKAGMVAALFLMTGAATFFYLHHQPETNKNTNETIAGETAPADASNKMEDVKLADVSPASKLKDLLPADNALTKTGTNNINDHGAANILQSAQQKIYTNNKIATNILSPFADGDADNNYVHKENAMKFLIPRYIFSDLITSGRKTTAQLKMPFLPAYKNIPCPEAEKDAAGNKSYFEFYAGPDYVFKNYSDTANSQYLQQRKASTALLFAVSAGVRFTKVFKNGMSVRTGLNYSRVHERFKHVKGNVTHNIYITNVAGDTTGTYTETGTQYQTSTNVYQTLDVPLIAGYELGNGKIHANVYAGAVVNVYSKQKGFVLDAAGNPVEISNSKTSSKYANKTNIGVSATAGVSFYYKLNERFHALAEPYVRYGLSSVTKPELTFKEKDHTAGLRLGLRMDL
jgi:hypothetical protein